MMKILLSGILILAIVSSCNSKKTKNNSSQSKLKEQVLFPFGDTTFSWKGIEKQNDDVKMRFEKMAPSLISYEYEFYHGEGGEHNTEKEFDQNCHVVDLNNDGLDDIIYTGSTGSEGSEVIVFLNTGKVFKKVLKQLQEVVKIEFRDNKLFRLYIRDTGCCDAWID